MPRDISTAGAVGRIALCGLFATVPRLVYKTEVHGLEHDTREPRTFYAIMHKRDMDGMTPVPPILAHRGWQGQTLDVHFAMRSDAFEPGFLSRLVPHPSWFSHILRPISVGPLLRSIGVHPLRDLHIRPAEVWLREALAAEGDQPVGELFTPGFLAQLATIVRQKPDRLPLLPLSELLKWRYHAALQIYHGPEIFRGEARRRAEGRVLHTAKSYLDELAAWLSKDSSLFTAAEGKLSPDGRLSATTSGVYRILHASPPDVRVLPIALAYDFMTRGRPRLFIDLAQPIEHAPYLSRSTLVTTLREAWLWAARFTCTQLASGVLFERAYAPDPTITKRELACIVHAQAKQLASRGRHVDKRLLNIDGTSQRIASYLAYCSRRGIVYREGRNSWRLHRPIHPLDVGLGEVGYHTAPLAYALNELAEMRSIV